LMVDWSPPLIWRWNLIWWWNLVCLVIKCRSYISIPTFYFEVCGPCVV
jgi:hypothetical protein